MLRVCLRGERIAYDGGGRHVRLRKKDKTLAMQETRSNELVATAVGSDGGEEGGVDEGGDGRRHQWAAVPRTAGSHDRVLHFGA